ncbi:hypothetical protein BZZ01_06890 [Nostocales cyanobacterium HT-58-2]|nr:hypothetical protein BZZ01_06890 [Nostocales cyanobacterium HT-58-2]
MKKTYNAPKLTNHGNVEEITQLFGSGSRNDFFIFTAPPNGINVQPNQPVPATYGSQDGVLSPSPTKVN